MSNQSIILCNIDKDKTECVDKNYFAYARNIYVPTSIWIMHPIATYDRETVNGWKTGD